jgi:exopolysaccharide biosynthesis polyprenyl glycosylphosphotransferase
MRSAWLSPPDAPRGGEWRNEAGLLRERPLLWLLFRLGGRFDGYHIVARRQAESVHPWPVDGTVPDNDRRHRNGHPATTESLPGGDSSQGYPNKLPKVAGPATLAEQLTAAGGRPLRRWLIKACIAAADCVAILIATGVAILLSAVLRGRALDTAREHVLLTMLSLPLWILVFLRYGLYRTRHIAEPLQEFRHIVHAVGASVLGLAVLGFLFKLWMARSWLLVFFAAAVVVLSAERRLIRTVFGLLRRRGLLLRPVVIVGGNTEAIALSAMLVNNPGIGYRVVGFVDNAAPVGSYLLDHKPVLGEVDQVVEVIRGCNASGALVATSAIDLEVTNRLALQVNEAGYYAELSLSLRGIAPERLAVRTLGHFQIASVGPVHRSGWRGIAKRALDVVGATTGLLLMAPVLALIAVVIKLNSNGSMLFRQERVGRSGKPFWILKFRTMVHNAEELMADLAKQNEADGPLFKVKNDPRVTRVGHVLRRYSLDELPQLWNVLRGDMSLVGPRPALPREVTGWEPELHQRLAVKPGITGMWQVNGRSSASFKDYVRLDLYYVDNWSLLTDLAIMVKTVVAVLRRHGAY